MNDIIRDWLVFTRKDALAVGAKFYWPNKPCIHGHMSERRADSALCVQCNRVRARRWNAANPERLRERVRIWQAANPERVKANVASRRERIDASIAAAQRKKPEKYAAMRRAREARRRARKRNTTGTFTPEDVLAIFTAQRGKCAYYQTCGTSLHARKFHVDHIVPIVRGGTNEPRNLQILCVSCNCKKAAQDSLDFVRARGLLI